MSPSIRSISRRLAILPALTLAAAILCGPAATSHAGAIWSADGYAAAVSGVPGAAGPIGSIGVIGNNFTGVSKFSYTLFVTNGAITDAYTAAGTFAESTTPGPGGTTNSALLVADFTITAAANNPTNVSDVMWFFSDIFPSLAPKRGYVGIGGAFSAPVLGQYGYTQGQLDYNGSIGGLPATAFLETAAAFNNPLVAAPFTTGFTRVTSGLIPVATNELTGLLAFTLAPGESVSFPFDFSDNVNVAGIVPEPTSIVMMTLGAVPLAIVAWKKRPLRRSRTVVTA
ncbi:MAG: PEP-CTERM sorting domain-containing protein [Isosphaeraceae bacterium]